MVIWWLCWHRTILIRNITQKPYSQFPPVHDFGKPWWGVAYVPCMTNLRALCAWVIRWHVTCMLSLAEHWQGRRALSNHVCAHSVTSMWHVVCLQHLARACSEQSRSTTVLPINHVIQMPQCLSGFVNHDYCSHATFTNILVHLHTLATWYITTRITWFLNSLFPLPLSQGIPNNLLFPNLFPWDLHSMIPLHGLPSRDPADPCIGDLCADNISNQSYHMHL